MVLILILFGVGLFLGHHYLWSFCAICIAVCWKVIETLSHNKKKRPGPQERVRGEEAPGDKKKEPFASRPKRPSIFAGVHGDTLTLLTLCEIYDSPGVASLGKLESMVPPQGIVELFFYHFAYGTVATELAAEPPEGMTTEELSEIGEQHYEAAVSLNPPANLVPANVYQLAEKIVAVLREKRKGNGENMASDKDYYTLLQVHPDADPAIIKSAYRTIMGELKMHPDLGGSTEKAQRLNEAYETLSDPDKRRAYDQLRGNRRGSPLPSEPEWDHTPPPEQERSHTGANTSRINCPKCGKEMGTPGQPRQTRASLIKHLSGLQKYGGHEVSQAEAEGIAFRVVPD